MRSGYCAICGRAADTHALCKPCSEKLRSNEGLCPEQIASYVPLLKHTGAVLIDPFGYIHPLGIETVLGRSPQAEAVFVRASSISRCHAEIRRVDDESYEVKDLGSKNGTFLNDARVQSWMPLVDGDRLRCGNVEFFFTTAGPGTQPNTPNIATEEVICEVDAPTQTSAAEPLPEEGLPNARFELLEPRGGGGGFLKVDDHVVPLTIPQMELLRALSNRMTSESEEPDIVRGYVRSAELLTHIPWDTQHPTENHLKQLIVRVRRNLARAGVDNLIESRRRLGYRLRVVPADDKET